MAEARATVGLGLGAGLGLEPLDALAANTARLAGRVACDDGEARLLTRRRLPQPIARRRALRRAAGHHRRPGGRITVRLQQRSSRGPLARGPLAAWAGVRAGEPRCGGVPRSGAGAPR